MTEPRPVPALPPVPPVPPRGRDIYEETVAATLIDPAVIKIEIAELFAAYYAEADKLFPRTTPHRIRRRE